MEKDKKFSASCCHQQVRQQCSVPFLWEEKPGTPKKDWKTETSPFNTVPLPSNLVTSSTPFKWQRRNCDNNNDNSEDKEEKKNGGDEEMLELNFEANTFDIDSNSSSYHSFLDCLFPLFSPDSGFLDKAGYHEKSSSLTLLDPQIEALDFQSNSTLMRRTPTLGELILISHRERYTKSIPIRKHKLPWEFMKKRVLGCCIFGTTSNRS